MKRSRFTEEQIIRILKEQEAGLPTTEVCRMQGIRSASFYKYKTKYSGRDVSDARKLKALEDENAKLKKLLAGTMLDIAILKNVASKMVTPDAKRDAGGLCLCSAWSEPTSGVFCVVDWPVKHAISQHLP